MEIRPGSLQVYFYNLFNGQKQLEAVGNQVINDNIALLQDSILPPIAQAIERKILKTANDVFLKAPANEFFP